MMRYFLLAWVVITGLVVPWAAKATPIVADLSNYRIDIDARFIGTRLFLFGSRNESGDIVVVLRGPGQKYTVRRKERVAGIWVNRRYVAFEEAPQFFALASSRSLETLNHPAIFKQLKLTPEYLLDVEEASSRKLKPDEFREAFFRYQHRRGLYNEPKILQFMGESLFKTTILFPDTIPRGDYHAEIYLLQNDHLIATQSIPISVSKVGFDGMLITLAHELPWLYGLIAIALALGAGWSANRIFQRF